MTNLVTWCTESCAAGVKMLQWMAYLITWSTVFCIAGVLGVLRLAAEGVTLL